MGSMLPFRGGTGPLRGRRGARLLVALALALAVVAALAATALADFPYDPNPSTPGTFDPHDYKLTASQFPMNFGDDFKLAASPESPGSNPADDQLLLANNAKPSELCGIRGASIVDIHSTQPAGTSSCIPPGTPVKTAFQVSTGRPDVTIAVLDSGIEWNNPDAMSNLRRKVHLNQGELPVPLADLTTSLDPAAVSDCRQLASSAGGAQNPNHKYDLIGNGAFNVTDYACDSRVQKVMTDARRVGPPGMLTPQDLILAFGNCKLDESTHTIASVGCPPGKHFDNDGNGFANDIAGWNFVDNNNDPYDDVQYGHGTGEARDSNAEAQSATKNGDLGTCPNCEVLPLRVGESFIADVNRFAQAAIYATDQGVDVIQEALGTLNNSNLASQAIDYAYYHGTTVIASAADEAAEHHNQPGALPHTIVVNSVTQYTVPTDNPHSYLQFNGCTNFSTKVTISVPSVSCSSEATGKSAGVAGLVYSAALNAHDANRLPVSGDPKCTRVDGTPCIVTPNEVRQLMGSGNIAGTQPQTGPPATTPASTGTTPADEGTGGQADDINFTQTNSSCGMAITPTCTDPNFNTSFTPEQNGGTVLPVAETTRYHARQGFDEFYGYGRLNAYNATHAVDQATIPPEADITSPDWFQQIDPAKPSVEIDGHTFARGQSYTCELDVAPGGQPNNAMAPTGDFIKVNGGFCDGKTPRTDPHDGSLGSISMADLKATFPSTVSPFNGNENGGLKQTSNGRPNTMPYAFTARVVVHVAQGAGGTSSPAMTGEDRRQMWLHRDQDTLKKSAFPMELHTDGASSPLLADLEGTNRNDLIVATSDGVIHAYRPDGSEAPGWPVHTDPLALHTGEHAFASGAISSGHYGAVLGGVAAGDLFHDGRTEIVAADNEGKVYAWDRSGRLVFKQEANPAFSGAMQGDENFVRKGARDRTEHGFFASPVLADLSGTGKETDIVLAGEDRHLYAWRPDPANVSGATVRGFPVEVYDHDKATVDNARTGHLTFNSKAGPALDQGKLVDTPTIASLDGPGKPPTIMLGTNEEYLANQGDEGPFNASLSNPTLAALGAAARVSSQASILQYANTRLYAINHDGTKDRGGPYRAGRWPVKLGIVDAGLLPDVAEGVTGPPVSASTVCTADKKTETVVGAESYAGPAYTFGPSGNACLGQSPDATSGQMVDNAMATDFSASAASGKTDTPFFPSVGNPAFGNVNGSIAYLSPASGLLRALDAAVPEYQNGGQDFLSAWDPKTGQLEPGYPSPVNDLSFLTGPAVGDVLGPPAGTAGQAVSTEQVVGGTASLDLQALNGSGPTAGQPASGAWPKLTGDWTVATPLIGSFGTLGTDAAAHENVISITRSGTLTVYDTPAPACAAASWPRYHHDIANSGDYTRDAVPPGVPMKAAVSAGKLTFTAPGDNLLCGKAEQYDLVTSDSPITPETFASAQAIVGAPAPQAAGASESVSLPAGTLRYVAVRAQDAAGNIGLPAVVDTGQTTSTGGGSSGSPGIGNPGGGSSGTTGSGPGSLPGPGGLGSGRTCLATQPRSTVSKRLGHGRRTRRGVTLHGRSVDFGCAPAAIRTVSVSIFRLGSHHRCQFLSRSGRVSRPRSCRRPLFIKTQLRRGRSGAVSWSLSLRSRLTRGRYEVLVRAVDVHGNRESGASRIDRLVFHVGTRQGA